MTAADVIDLAAAILATIASFGGAIVVLALAFGEIFGLGE